MEVFDIEAVVQDYVFSAPAISITSMQVSEVNLPSQKLQNIQHLDIQASIAELFAEKQDNLTSASEITIGNINGISATTLAFINPTSGIQEQINSKASLSSNNEFSGVNTYTGNSTYNSVTLSPSQMSKIQYLDVSSSLTTQLSNKQATIDSNTDLVVKSLNNIPSATLAYIDPSSSIQTQINSKASLSDVQSNNNTYTGHNYFNTYCPVTEIQCNSNYQIANKKYVDDQISSVMLNADNALNSITELATALGNDSNYASTITTALGTKATLSANNTFSGNNTHSGNDNFSGTNTFTGNCIYNSVTLTPSQMSNIQYCDVSSSLTTQLSNKQNSISNINTLTGYVAPVDLTSAQTIAGIKTFSSAPVMSGASITSGTIPNSALQTSYLSTSSASSTYQPIISGSSNLTTGSVTATGLITSQLAICEKFNAINASSTNVYNLNYATGNCFFINTGQMPSANFTINISNIPTTSTNQYTLSLVYQANFIPSLVSATDTGSTTIYASAAPKWAGGTQPSVSSSALYLATFTIVGFYSTKYIICNVSTFN